MAKGGIGVLIAKAVPPPDKLKGYGKDRPEEGDEEPGQTEGDEDKEARVSMMQEFMDVCGMKGNAEEACDALERYLDAAGYKRA